MLPQEKEVIIVKKKDRVIINSKYMGMLSEDIIGLIDDEMRYKTEQDILNCKQIKTQRIF